MKEHPILFTTDSVKAILDNRKSQTRRVVKQQPPYHPNIEEPKLEKTVLEGAEGRLVIWQDVYSGQTLYCPFGQKGDRLWARETWATEKHLDHLSPSEIGNASVVPLWYKVYDKVYEEERAKRGRWRSGRFMPRWASRIILENTIDPYPQRLQEIEKHPENYKSEGYTPIILDNSAIDGKPFEASMDFAWFENLWDSLNAKRYPWESNPLIWVIEFKRVTV